MKNIKILIADDDFLVNQEIARALKKMGYEIAGVASNGLEAIEMTCALKPDIVLMDIRMPEINGLEASRMIQSKCPTPVIILTAHDSLELAEKAGKMGASGYLIKPIKTADVEKAITIAMARHADLMKYNLLNQGLQKEIEKRKQTEKLLRTQNLRYYTLLQNLDGLVYHCENDADWTMKFISAGCLKLTGYKPEDLIDNNKISYNDIILPKYQIFLQEKWQEILENHLPIEVEYKIRTASGDIKWVWERGSGIFNEDGTLSHLEGFITDITERKQAEEKLENTQKKLLNIFKAAENVSFILTDTSETSPLILEFSPGAEKIFGYKREEVIGKPVAILHLQEDVKKFPEMIKANRNKQKGFSGESVLVRKNGEHFSALFTTFPVINEKGKMIESVGISIDISERKKAEKALKESEALLKLALENTENIIFIQDTEGKYIYFNSPKIFNIKSNEVIGKTPTDFLEPIYASSIMSRFRKVLSTKESINSETNMTWQGASLWFFDQSSPIINSEGKVTAVVTFSQNITERKNAEITLKESEERFRSIFSNISNISVQGYDKSRKVTYWNKASEKLYGYSKEEALNKQIEELVVPPEKRKGVISFINNWLENGIKIPDGELVLMKKDKSLVNVFSSHVMIENADGEKELFCIDLDFTEQKNAEMMLLKMQKLESVGTLAGGIAHDFNNILTGVFGNISLAKENLSHDHSSFKRLEDAEISMNRSIRLTKQLLTFAKGGAPIMEEVRLKNIIEKVVKFDLSGSNVLPVFEIPDSLWAAKVDKGQIQQVFSNMTINANQSMPDGGHLYISLENAEISDNQIPGICKGDYIKVVVRDEGSGIDKRYLDKIFDPYFTTKQAGSGLGLATSFSIINKHNGHISVISELGNGSTFTLYLPALRTHICPDAEQTSSDYSNAEISARILVMDDEEMILKLTSKMLSKIGCSVDTAHDGKQAIEKYKQSLNAGKAFDAVIMDLTIPGGIGGKEAIRDILEIDPEAKVIVSSGYSDDPVMANYSEYGFKGIIAKPYTFDNLKDIINQVITNTVS